MDKTIFIRIRGGLGNQMFQYAFAYMLSKAYNYSRFVFDIREFDNYYWPFELNQFNLPKNFELSNCKLKYDQKINNYHIYQGIYRRLFHKSPISLKRNLIKKGYLFCGQYCEMPPQNLPDNIYLYGYFQNANLLNDVREELVNVFAMNKKTKQVTNYLKKLKSDSVSINVRFAKEIEIANKEKYVYSSKDYYIRLANDIKRRRNKNVQLVISSNDIESIKKEGWFSDFDDVIYIDNCSPIEQLEIMKHCHDFILTNSTFSWWIGYLGSYNKNSIVYAPNIWFQGQEVSDTKIAFDEMKIVE